MADKTLRRRPAHTHQEPPGRRLFDLVGNRFQPLQEIGCGAVCLVHLAEDKHSGKTVALKRLRGDMLANRNARYTLQTENEALTLMRRARHCGIPQNFTASLDGSDPYLAEQYMEGLPFALNNIQGRRSVLILSIGICDILSALHDAGIVYRDLKPSNLVLGYDRFTVGFTDFGYAKVPTMPDFAMRVSIPVGTPMFMAPEQTYPKAQVDRRVDIYAAGMIAYQFLSGWYPYNLEPPEEGMSAEEKREFENNEYFRAHRSQEPVPLHMRNPSIPSRLSHAVSRALAKEPSKRYQDAEEFADALSDCLASYAAT